MTILTSCASSGSRLVEATYPEIPSDIRTCFKEAVPAPPDGELTRADVIHLIAALKQSEAEKSECGQRLIAFYDSLAD